MVIVSVVVVVAIAAILIVYFLTHKPTPPPPPPSVPVPPPPPPAGSTCDTAFTEHHMMNTLFKDTPKTFYMSLSKSSGNVCEGPYTTDHTSKTISPPKSINASPVQCYDLEPLTSCKWP